MEEEIKLKTEEQPEKKETRRYQFLSLKTKIDILNKLNEGERPIRIANEYGIALSTISRLKKCKTSLEEAMNMYQNNAERRSLRGTFHPKMESSLHKWYLEQCENGVAVTGPVLRLKARELNKMIRENDLEFRASPGWMEKFKKRYGIRLKSSRGERQTTDNIAFEFDEHDDNEVKTEMDMNTEDILYEPAFVQVNNLEDFVTDRNDTEKNYTKVIQCVDDVIQWTVKNDIEPLYLTMLRSLRDRIRYQART